MDRSLHIFSANIRFRTGYKIFILPVSMRRNGAYPLNQIFDGMRVILTLSFLFYASWSDWKKREVSNKVWAVLGPVALLLTSVQYVLFAKDLIESLVFYGLSCAVMSGLAIILFYAGAFGGADAKALICLSLALPHYPIYLLSSPQPYYSPLFPITVFSNSVLLAAFTVVYALLRNLSWKLKTGSKLFEGLETESLGRKLLAVLTGYKTHVAKLERYDYLYPLEDISAAGESLIDRKLLMMPKDEDREKIVARILDAARTGRIPDKVWATPGLPMLIFITAGLIIALVFGDLVWALLFFALG